MTSMHLLAWLSWAPAAAADLPGVDRVWVWRPLVPFAVAWWVLLLTVLPRDREAVLLTLLAAGVRLTAGVPKVHLHVDKAYGQLLGGTGHGPITTEYGDAWAAVIGVAAAPLGGVPDAVHAVCGLVSVLTVPLTVAVVRRLVDGDAARWAGLLLALSPWPVAMATTETRFGLVALLQVGALLGLVLGGRRGDLLAGLSAGLLAHLRPLQVVVAVAVLGALAWRRRPLGGALLAGLVGWRAAGWLAETPDPSGLVLRSLGSDDFWRHLVGPDGMVLWLDPTRTPGALAALALLGAARAVRHQPGLRAPAALAIGGTLAYAHQPALADRLRFELPVTVWVSVLAGAGLVWLVGRVPRLRWPLLAALALSWWPARQPYPPFAWQREYAALRVAAATAPTGVTVRYDARLDPDRHLWRWVNLTSAARWEPLQGETGPMEWRWVGLADHASGASRTVPVGHEAVRTWTFTPQWGGLEHYGPWDPAPVTLGLYAPP